MPWKLDITAQLPQQAEREPQQQQRPSRKLGGTLLLLAALLAVVYGRSGPAVAPLPDTLDFGSVLVSAPGQPRVLDVQNQGSSALTLSNLVISGNQASDFKLLDSACATAATPPGQKCQIGVVFQPTAPGERTATLLLTDDARDSPQSVTLIGNGVERADLKVTPAVLAFGDQSQGATSDWQQVMLSNDGTEAITVSDVAFSGDSSAFTLQAEQCIGLAIPANTTCAVMVRFAPTDTGSHTARLLIKDSTGDQPHEVEISGSGTVAPTANASISPLAVNFGRQQVGSSASQTVTISNSGNAPFETSGIEVNGEGESEFAIGSQCSHGQIAAGGQCSLPVRFTPRAQGRHTAQLVVSGNGSETRQVLLLGYGVPPPPPPPPPVHNSGVGNNNVGNNKGGASPPSNNTPTTATPPPALIPRILAHPGQEAFTAQSTGSQGQPRPVTVTSIGSAPAQINGISLEGNSSQDFSVSDVNCAGRLLRPNDTCTVNVAFAPKATITDASQRNASLVVNIDKGASARVSLSGAANEPPRMQAQFTVNPGYLQFGSVQVGARSGAQSVTVSNSGSDAIQLTTVALRDAGVAGAIGGHNPGHYTFAGTNCPKGLVPAHGSCNIGLQFGPQKAGNLQAQLTLASTSPTEVQTVTLSGVGIQPNNGGEGPPHQAGFVVQPNVLNFGRAQTGTQVGAQTVTLINRGASPIRLTSLGLSDQNQFRLTNNSCQGNVIPGNGSCTMSFVFTPRASGNFQARLSVGSSSPAETQSVLLSGIGLGQPQPQGWCCVKQGSNNLAMMAERSGLTLKQANRDACSQVGGTFFTDYKTAKERCVSAPPQGNTNLHGSQTYVQPKPQQHQQQVN